MDVVYTILTSGFGVSVVNAALLLLVFKIASSRWQEIVAVLDMLQRKSREHEMTFKMANIIIHREED